MFEAQHWTAIGVGEALQALDGRVHATVHQDSGMVKKSLLNSVFTKANSQLVRGVLKNYGFCDKSK